MDTAEIKEILEKGKPIQSKLNSLRYEMNEKYALFLQETYNVDISSTSYFKLISLPNQFNDYVMANFETISKEGSNRFIKLEIIDHHLIIMIDADSPPEIGGDLFFALTSWIAEFHPDLQFFEIIGKWC